MICSSVNRFRFIVRLHLLGRTLNLSGGNLQGQVKTHHFLAFFALALPISFARPRLALWITLGAIAYGGAIELIQPYVGRDKDIYDLLADGAGAVSGAALGVGLSWLRDRLA